MHPKNLVLNLSNTGKEHNFILEYISFYMY